MVSFLSYICDYFGKMVTFHILGQLEFSFEGKHVVTLLCIISTLRASFLLRKVCQGFLAYVVNDENDLNLKDISIIRDYLNVFLDDLSGLSLKRNVEFTIELVQMITLISKASYKMAPMELKELKV